MVVTNNNAITPLVQPQYTFFALATFLTIILAGIFSFSIICARRYCSSAQSSFVYSWRRSNKTDRIRKCAKRFRSKEKTTEFMVLHCSSLFFFLLTPVILFCCSFSFTLLIFCYLQGALVLTGSKRWKLVKRLKTIKWQQRTSTTSTGILVWQCICDI